MLMHLILYTYFTFFQNSINIRVIIQSFFLLIIALQISVLSLTEVKAVYNSMHIPFTLSSIILTFFHSSRFLFYILYSEAETNFMSAHIINSVLAVIHFSGLYVFQILFIILCYFKAYTDLNESKKEIIHLQELLPICSHCHKIRDDKGYWEKIDLFIQKNSEIQFSHGLCPECLEKYYSEYTGKTKSSE